MNTYNEHTKYYLPLLLILVFLWGCPEKGSEKKDRKEISVRTKKIISEHVPEILHYSGNIMPYKTIKFGFMDAGKIKAVHVVEGQYVYEGDLIAELEATDYEYSLEAAKAQYEEALNEYKRLKSLYNKGSLTKSDYDKITALYKEAKADYEYKKKQLRDTKLYAPDDGWIAVEGVQPGEIIPQGMPVFGLVHTKKVFAETAIPENEINHIKLNMDVKVKIPALNDTVYNGLISRIGQVADPYARSFPVKATLDNNNFHLKPGMIASLLIPAEKTIEKITIPAKAVLIDANGQTHVFVVKKNIVSKQKVITGKAIADNVEIMDGLKSGDVIVTEGTNKLYEGAQVKVLD